MIWDAATGAEVRSFVGVHFVRRGFGFGVRGGSLGVRRWSVLNLGCFAVAQLPALRKRLDCRFLSRREADRQRLDAAVRRGTGRVGQDLERRDRGRGEQLRGCVFRVVK